MYFTTCYTAPKGSIVETFHARFKGLCSGTFHLIELNSVTLPCGRVLIVAPAANYLVPVPDNCFIYDAVFQSVNSAFIALTRGGTLFKLAMPRSYFYKACHVDYRGGYTRNGIYYNLSIDDVCESR